MRSATLLLAAVTAAGLSCSDPEPADDLSAKVKELEARVADAEANRDLASTERDAATAVLDKAAAEGRMKSALHQSALAMEEHWGEHETYVGATASYLHAQNPDELDGVTIEVRTASAERYALCAHPEGNQSCSFCFDSDTGQIEGGC